MAKTDPMTFYRQVQLEAKKVSWPSRRETLQTTGMVLLMSFVAAIFFMLVDTILSGMINLIIPHN